MNLMSYNIDLSGFILFKILFCLRTNISIKTTSGEEVLDKLKVENVIIVILAGYRSPGMKGVEFLEKAKQLAPLITRIIMTAYQNAEMM